MLPRLISFGVAIAVCAGAGKAANATVDAVKQWRYTPLGDEGIVNLP